ncbi:MAG: hypothetical protein ACKN81_13500, partial [Pirellulaceae bacterium]
STWNRHIRPKKLRLGASEMSLILLGKQIRSLRPQPPAPVAWIQLAARKPGSGWQRGPVSLETG